MCHVTFYKNNDYDGDSDYYADPQGKESGVMNGIDSMKTGSDTWVVVYNSKYYEGDWMKVGPSTSLSDLNNTSRSGGGDWKNQIQSFVMYDSKPSFWDTSSGTPTLDLNGCKVYFTENTNLKGDNKTYSGSTSVDSLLSVGYTTDLTKSMYNSINSLKTGTGAWLAIYDETNYGGNYKRIYPNTTYKDLNSVSRGTDGDWKNQIQSFELYNQLPSNWSLSFDQDTFKGLFDGEYTDNKISGDAFAYQTQDAEYRIYAPTISYPSIDTMVVSLSIDHIIGMSTDDHVTLDLTFNSDGLISITNYTWDAGSNYQIPDGVVKAVDISAEILGAVGALESCGISEAAANEFIEVFDTACKVFNDISNLMAKWSENDGGRFYLIPVVAHVINRACYSVVKS
ncbi:MAG: hypothetical protein R2800_01095 [Flavipsychrobacter sp.]